MRSPNEWYADFGGKCSHAEAVELDKRLAYFVALPRSAWNGPEVPFTGDMVAVLTDDAAGRVEFIETRDRRTGRIVSFGDVIYAVWSDGCGRHAIAWLPLGE